MFIYFRATLILTLLGASLLTGCATEPKRSADIATQAPHPSKVDNFQIVVPGGVYRSGQPKTKEDWDYLQGIGIKTIVKLNKFDCEHWYSCEDNYADEYKEAHDRGITVIPIYLQPEDWPKNWNLSVRPKLEDVMRAVEVLERRGDNKVLVHCAHGRDRTGLVIAAFNMRNRNYCKEAAYNQMRFFGASPTLQGVKDVFDSLDTIPSPNPNCTNEFEYYTQEPTQPNSVEH